MLQEWREALEALGFERFTQDRLPIVRTRPGRAHPRSRALLLFALCVAWAFVE